MRQWFSDGIFRAILRNAAYLGSGKLVGTLLGLISLACAGHALSPAIFGTVALIDAYANGVSNLAKFQTWPFIVRFGAPALIAKDTSRFRDIISFAFGLDVASGLVGLIAGMALLPFLAHWLGIEEKYFAFTLLYCTLIPTMTVATPTGILRTLDRFDQIALQQLVTPLLRAIGSGISFVGGFGFAGFITTWYISELVGDMTLWWLAAREMRRSGFPHALRPGLFAPAKRIPGAWDFVWTTNISHSVWSAWGPLSNVIVGGMLGPASAGLFKIASMFFQSAGKPAEFLGKSFYREIMRLDPASKHPWQLGLRSSLLGSAMAIVMLLIVSIGGKPLIALIFGRKYLEAYDLLQIMSISLLISMASFPLESLLYMANRQRTALVTQGLAALIYGVLLVALIHWFGLKGAGVAYVGGVSLNVLFTFIPTISTYRRRMSLAISDDVK